VKVKSNEVVTSIQALLVEFGAGATAVDQGPTQAPAPEIKLEKVPLIELPTVEQVTEDHTPPVAEEQLEGPKVVTEQESAPLHEGTEEPTVDKGPSSDEETDEGEDGEGEDGEGEDDEGEDGEDEDGEDEDDDE